MPRRFSCLGLALAPWLMAMGPALAADPEYVGVWAAKPAQCKTPQDTEAAPMIVKAAGYDQHETHCAFTSVSKARGVWKIKAACSVQGDKQTDAFTLKVIPLKTTGSTLTIKRGKASQTLVRC
jgi:hypothetical protein